MDDVPVLSVTGERVAIGPLRRDLVPLYHRWNNAVATTRTFALAQPSTLEQEEALYTELTTSRDMAMFTVYEAGSATPVGIAYLTDIDHRHGCAEFGIMIGDEGFRGLGYGTEATRLALDYAFTALGLRSVMLTVYEYNLAGRRSYEKAGFREFGRRRQSHRMGDRFWDVIYMDCLAEEFASPVLAASFVPDVER